MPSTSQHAGMVGRSEDHFKNGQAYTPSLTSIGFYETLHFKVYEAMDTMIASLEKLVTDPNRYFSFFRKLQRLFKF